MNGYKRIYGMKNCPIKQLSFWVIIVEKNVLYNNIKTIAKPQHMSTTSISIIKKLSLILTRKAYIVYTNSPFPSLFVPLPQVDNTLKSAVVKTFTDLTNGQTLTFNHKKTTHSHINQIYQANAATIQIDDSTLPNYSDIESIENIAIKPDSLFLTFNCEDSSLVFMKYQQIRNSILNAKKQSEQSDKQTEKQKEQKTDKESPNKQNKKQIPSRKPGEQQEFKDESVFEHKQMSTWNEQAPQLATKPEDQPKEDISSLRTNKFVPLGLLTGETRNGMIEVSHIQSSRQYLLVQIMKVFFLANVLCVYGLVNEASRTENHEAAKQRIG